MKYQPFSDPSCRVPWTGHAHRARKTPSDGQFSIPSIVKPPVSASFFSRGHRNLAYPQVVCGSRFPCCDKGAHRDAWNGRLTKARRKPCARPRRMPARETWSHAERSPQAHLGGQTRQDSRSIRLRSRTPLLLPPCIKPVRKTAEPKALSSRP